MSEEGLEGLLLQPVILDSLLGSSYVVHLYIQAFIWTSEVFKRLKICHHEFLDKIQSLSVTIKGFVEGRAVLIWSEKGRGLASKGLIAVRGRRRRGVCLCTCVSVASWETGRKQDLKLQQHPVPPSPSSPLLTPPPMAVYASLPASQCRKKVGERWIRSV